MILSEEIFDLKNTLNKSVKMDNLYTDHILELSKKLDLLIIEYMRECFKKAGESERN